MSYLVLIYVCRARKSIVYLISVDEYYLLHVQRKQHVQEEYLVSPDGSLFLRLLMKPTRPLVLHELVLEAIFLGHVRQKVLQRGKGNVLINCDFAFAE